MHPQAEEGVCMEGGAGVHTTGTCLSIGGVPSTQKAFPSAISRDSEIEVPNLSLFNSQPVTIHLQV